MQILNDLDIPAFTRWKDVQAKSRIGRPRMGTDTWPGLNYAITFAVEEEVTKLLFTRIREFNETTNLYSSTSITYGYITGDVYQIAGPFLVKQDTDISSQQFAVLTSTLGMVATYPIGSYTPEFRFTFDFWCPHDKQLFDDLLPHSIRLKKAYIRLPLTETFSILLGKDKLPLGWQDPSEIQEAGLPLLSGSGNLWTYYPQLRIESFYKQFFWQLYFMQVNGKYHNAEEYLEDEQQLSLIHI